MKKKVSLIKNEKQQGNTINKKTDDSRVWDISDGSGDIFSFDVFSFILFGLFTIISLVIYTISNNALCEQKEVEAKVTYRNFKEGSVTETRRWNGFAVQTYRHKEPDEYIVIIEYDDVTATINSKKLYDLVREGDVIKMNLIIYYNKDGEITKKELQLPDKIACTL